MPLHIIQEDAYAHVLRISKATGLLQSTLKTAIQVNVEKKLIWSLFQGIQMFTKNT